MELCVLAASAAFRTVGITSPSYIHPDEIFQSQEVAAAAALSRFANVPWEFADCAHPSRSMLSVVPALWSTSALEAVAKYTGFLPATSEIWFARVPYFLAAMASDALVVSIATEYGVSGMAVRLILLSSWVASILLLRPFSNSLESFALVALLKLYLRLRRILHGSGSSIWQTCFLGTVIGAVSTCGVFFRFSFVIFAAPIVCVCILECFYVAVYSSHYFRALHLGILCASVASSSLVCITAAVVLDTFFFGGPSLLLSHEWSQSTLSQLRVAPWNNFLYNLDLSNLAAHGLHPRYQHLLINGHVMFGPLWTLAWVAVVGTCVQLLWGRWGMPSVLITAAPSQETSKIWPPAPQQLSFLCSVILVFSTIVISAAPHQEPRFLAPLLYPLALIGASITPLGAAAVFAWCQFPRDAHGAPLLREPRRPWRSIVAWGAWLAFNAAAGRLFGVVHQGSLLPGVAAIGDALRQVASADCDNPAQRILPSYLSSMLQARIADSLEKCGCAGTCGDLLSSVTVTFVGVYMAPHSLLGLPAVSCASPAAAAKTTSFSALVARAPWCAPDREASPSQRSNDPLHAARELRERGGTRPSPLFRAASEPAAAAAAAASAAPRGVVFVREYSEPDSASFLEDLLALSRGTLSGPAQTGIATATPAPVQLVVFPSTVHRAVASALAGAQQASSAGAAHPATLPRRTCRLQVLHAQAPFVSLEHPPRTLRAWAAAMLPRVLLPARSDDSAVVDDDVPSLVFSRIACEY